MLNQPLHNEELEPNFQGTSSDIQVEGLNPFPGLRSFSIDESYLFFGREGQIDEILLKISQHRFVTVMGYSGSGKSSLMYCGLVPVLYGGFMTASGPHWNIVVTRPGTAPIQSLTSSIVDTMVKNNKILPSDVYIYRAIISSILRSGENGLIEVCKYLQSEKNENIFFLVDQFEELFRYRAEANEENPEAVNDAQLYVKLFLTAVKQNEVPVYVALTMRSDFIGECSAFSGLTQLINDSNYLVPQMTREQKRAAIEGPVSVAGGKISARLTKRLLADVGNDQDQLPILQHALMRTWDYWMMNRDPGEPIDLRHYNAVGKMSQALSLHANESYDELTLREKEIAEVLFKSITEKNQDNKGLRRPCRLGLIAELAEASESEVIQVVNHFRRPGRSFLMPAAHVPLTSDSLIELSHESLMRIWNRLEGWVEDESESAAMYKRLSEAAAMYQIGKTGLWRPPDLQLALNWQKKQKPTREWAERYDNAFERAIVFLDTSRITYEAELKNQEMMQRRVLRRTRATAVILGIAFLIAILFFVFAYMQKIQADLEKIQAEKNRMLAEEQRKIAETNRKVAEKRTKQVESQRLQIEASNEELKKTLEELTVERNRAQAALIKAQQEEVRALAAGEKEKEAKEQAQLNAEEAQLNYQYANQLFMLTKAQELASKAAVQDDDNELAGLLAMQAYHFHKRYKGRKYDPYIYNGLYSALTKLSGAAYNAMKIQGPLHVHLRSLAVSKNSSNIYVAGADGRIYNGDIEKLTNVPTGFQTPYPSKVIALSKDENYIINGSDSSFIQIYTLQERGSPRIVRNLSGSVHDIEFLPDNTGAIISSRGNALYRVNHLTGELKLLSTLPAEFNALSVSADGKFVAGASWSGKVFLYNLQDNTVSTILDEGVGNRILSIKFSPSGGLLAYGMEDTANKRGLVKIYDLQTKTTRQFTGHKAGVYDVEFSPDEKLLASAGSDKRLQLYVLEAPDDLPVVMENNNGFIWDIEFAKGSNYLIATCSESEIRVWPTDPSLLAEQICPNSKMTRNMTQDEWKKYVGNDIQYENTCVRLLIKEY
jgi:energy-coupling factor transporter ATP-binding protein EcfA2